MTEIVARLAAERAAVLERLAGLRDDRERFVEASRDSNADDEHDPEGHTIAYERSQVDAHVRLAEQRLAEIDAALDRVAAGSYGTCTSCGRPIPPERLAVRAAASSCVACAAAGGNPGLRGTAFGGNLGRAPQPDHRRVTQSAPAARSALP